MSIDIPQEDFDLIGNLSSNGKHDLWHEIDRGFKKFNQNDITLRPCLNLKSNAANAAVDRNKEKRKKLPMPPPVHSSRPTHNQCRSQSHSRGCRNHSIERKCKHRHDSRSHSPHHKHHRNHGSKAKHHLDFCN